MLRLALLILLLTVSIFPFGDVHAQCCAHGCTIGNGKDDGTLNKYTLEIGARYKYSRSQTYYNNDSPVYFRYLDHSFYNFSGLSAAYGITERYSAEAELGYYFDKTQQYVFNRTLIGNGLGDLTVENKYAVIKNQTQKTELTFGAGVRFPTGPFQERTKEGVLLSRDVQSGTGAYGFVPSLFMMKEFKDSTYQFFMNARAEMNGTNADQYRYGNDYDLSVSGSKQFSRLFSVALQVRGELHQTDEQFNIELSSSGFRRIIFVPQLTFDLKNKWELFAAADIPVYQYFTGIQFANAYAISFGVSRKILLKAK